jgi:MHS family proline/betaine transporter-like MFS transporter
MLSSGTLQEVYFAMAIFTFIFSIFIPAAFNVMVETFHTEIRYTGLSFGFNIGLALFGGTCPLIATWLIHISQNNTSPAFYIMIFAVISFITSLFIHDKRGMTIN